MFEQPGCQSLCVCVCERLAGLPVHSGSGITAGVERSDGDDGSSGFMGLIITDDFNNLFESEG